MTSSFKKTAVAAAVVGTFAAAIPQAEANVVNFSWSGAWTFLNPTGAPFQNNPSDYATGYYADGDGTSFGFGAPYYPNNVGPNATPSPYYSGAINTAHGWYGKRTPVSGTLSFDTSTGAGVGTINPFFFCGDTPGTGPNTSVASLVNPTFQIIDTVGTIVGSMLFSWNGGGHSVSIVMDGSGLLGNLIAMMEGGFTSTVSGVGALPATETTNFGTAKIPVYAPLGPTPIATKTLNTGAGCDGLTLATQVNAYTIVTNFANVATCTTGMADDGIGGDPMTSLAFPNHTFNLDMMSLHLDPPIQCTSCPPPEVPVPPAVWLFGSGLLGLIGLARRKKKPVLKVTP
jgi:hypothetical protein